MSANTESITMRLRCVNAAECPIYANDDLTVVKDRAVDLRESDAACSRLLAELSPYLEAFCQDSPDARRTQGMVGERVHCHTSTCNAEFVLQMSPKPKEASDPDAPPMLSEPAAVADLPLLRRLDVLHAQTLTDAAEFFRAQEDQPLTTVGEPLASLLLISEGEVGLFETGADVRPVRRLGPGEVIGLWEVLTDGAVRFIARPLGPAAIWRLRRPALINVLQQDEELREAFSTAALDDLARVGIDWPAYLASGEAIHLPLTGCPVQPDAGGVK